MFVLNTLCMTQFVTSSVAVFEAARLFEGNINVYDKIVMKKGENMEIEEMYTQFSI